MVWQGITPLEVNGANPTMKKWSRGKGTRLTASFLKSLLSCPGNLKQEVTPVMADETMWFKSPQVGWAILRVLVQMLYKASLSMIMHQSLFSINWWKDNTELYGSTTVSETLAEGTIENVCMIRSGYSSLSFAMINVPSPDPVPPPKDWVNWNPWKLSQFSAYFLVTSKTSLIISVPSVQCPFAQLFPAPFIPNRQLSGLNRFPAVPALTESSAPGSRSTSIDLGTYLPPIPSSKQTLSLSICRSEVPSKFPVCVLTPCSSATSCQNLEPIWFPHCPTCRQTISLMCCVNVSIRYGQ